MTQNNEKMLSVLRLMDHSVYVRFSIYAYIVSDISVKNDLLFAIILTANGSWYLFHDNIVHDMHWKCLCLTRQDCCLSNSTLKMNIEQLKLFSKTVRKDSPKRGQSSLRSILKKKKCYRRKSLIFSHCIKTKNYV